MSVFPMFHPSQLHAPLHAVLPKYELPVLLEKASNGDKNAEATLDGIAAGFQKRTFDYITGAIGAIDGLLLPIVRPKNDPGLYHCRKGFYAQNVQAISDVNGRILYASIKAPGSAHDSFAWRLDSHCEKIRGDDERWANYMRRRGYYLLGDDAYSCSHTLVTPWSGRFEPDDPKLGYNLCHSSARIAVECAFGMLCRRWLITKRPYEGTRKRTKTQPGMKVVFDVCAKLHNYVIGDRVAGAHLPDVTGQSDPLTSELGRRGGAQQPRRKDHLGRDLAVEVNLPHVTSENPKLAEVEKAVNKDATAAKAAACPAWSEDAMKDPEWGNPDPVCQPRAVATEQMGRDGFKRTSYPHWY